MFRKALEIIVLLEFVLRETTLLTFVSFYTILICSASALWDVFFVQKQCALPTRLLGSSLNRLTNMIFYNAAPFIFSQRQFF